MTRQLSGLRAWLVQRLSALYIGLFVLVASLALAFDRPVTFAQWRSALAHPAVSTTVLLFFAALFVHAWVGIRDIVLDYARSAAWRLGLLVFVGFSLLLMSAWVGRILLEVAK